nr:terminase small subunit [Endozoicomonas sp.]
MSAKHRRFVEEYLVDQNATRAAIAAGYSERTARSQGSRLLTNADISTEIRARQNKLSRELKITAQDKRARLWQIAQFCSDPVAGDEGELRMRNPRAATAAIAELNKMDGDYQQKAGEETSVNFIQIFGPEADDLPDTDITVYPDSNLLPGN